MSVNIACSVPKCSNPVIGQCTGYKKTCGRYYCHEHSSDTLCADCGSQKAADEHAEMVYHEYLTLAQNITKEPLPIPKFEFPEKRFVKPAIWLFAIGIVSLVILIIIGIIVGSLTEQISQVLTSLYALSILATFGLMGLPLLLIPVYIIQDQTWAGEHRKKIIAERINETERVKPGFLQFWNAWTKQRQEEQAEKNRQALMGVLAVAGVIAAGVIAAGLSESEYDRTRRAVRDENNSR